MLILLLLGLNERALEGVVVVERTGLGERERTGGCGLIRSAHDTVPSGAGGCLNDEAALLPAREVCGRWCPLSKDECAVRWPCYRPISD